MPGGSNVIHFNATRTRVVGVGNLDYQFLGYNDILTETLSPIAMATTDAREKNRLANFKSQFARLKGSTDEINEVFRINSIIIFAKGLWSDYPG